VALQIVHGGIDFPDITNYVYFRGGFVSDQRVVNMARVLVDYSVNVCLGDKVLIEATLLAEPLVREVYRRVLERGGHPHILFSLPDQEEILYQAAASDDQLDFTPALHLTAVEQFDARIRIYSEGNTRGLSSVDPARVTRRQKALAVVQGTVFRRAGAEAVEGRTSLGSFSQSDAGEGLGMRMSGVAGIAHRGRRHGLLRQEAAVDKVARRCTAEG